MKIVFVIISCLSIAYLLAQTSMVKNAGAELYNTLNNTQHGNKRHSTDVQGAKTKQAFEDLLTKYEAVKEENIALNKAFESKISALEHNISSLQKQLSELKKPQTTQLASKTPLPTQALIREASEANTKPSNNVNTMPGQDALVTMQGNELNEQHKRLKQQALLRQIAEKMELSALHSLSSN